MMVCGGESQQQNDNNFKNMGIYTDLKGCVISNILKPRTSMAHICL